MECFFFEWYQDNDNEGPYGRTFVSNNTQAVETSMKEGGVSSLVSISSSRQPSDKSVLDASGCCAVKLTSLLYREPPRPHANIAHAEAMSVCLKLQCCCVRNDNVSDLKSTTRLLHNS